MTTTQPLAAALLAPAARPQAISDIVALIQAEVDRKSGLSGLAIKAGFAVVKKLRGGQMLPHSVDWLLDEFVAALEPFYAEYRGGGGAAADRAALQAFFTRHQARVADGLLAVTDRRAQRAKNALLVKTYQKLRPTAQREVQAALPGVAAVIARRVKD